MVHGVSLIVYGAYLLTEDGSLKQQAFVNRDEQLRLKECIIKR